jgi:hypothetical protein
MAPRGASVELTIDVPGLEPPARGQVPTPDDWITSEDWLGSWPPPFDVVRGEHYRGEALLRLVGSDGGEPAVVPVELRLIREPENSYDANALRVETGGAHVGYIAKELAAVVSPVFDAAAVVSCRYAGVIVGGFEWQSAHQVYVWLDRRLGEGPDLEIRPEFVFAIPVWPPEDLMPTWPTVERFYAHDREISSAWSDRDLERVARLSQECREMLPAFVAEATAQRENEAALLSPILDDPTVPEDLRNEWAEAARANAERPLVPHLSAIEFGGQIFSAVGNRPALEEFRSAVAAEPQLSNLLPEVDEHIERLELIERVLAWVAANPGAIQKDLHAVIPADKKEIQYACYLAAMVGRLKRTKAGSSYALEVTA